MKKLQTEGSPTIGRQLVAQLENESRQQLVGQIHKPIGVSEYQLTQLLPENLKSSLPSIEEIEAELGGMKDTGGGDE